MLKSVVSAVVLGLLGCVSAFAQGPCATQSNDLACMLIQEYGSAQGQGFTSVLYNYNIPGIGTSHHATHFSSDFQNTLRPLIADIGRQANLLPLASPSSGILLVYDPTLKTLVAKTDSLGPILGERAETIGRHHLFIGFSYQYFNFDSIDGVSLKNVPAVFTHTNDAFDNAPPGQPNFANPCSITTSNNLGPCGFVRDRIDTMNSIGLKVNQYTTYITFGLTNRIDLSMVIPFENVRMSLSSQATIVPGTNGNIPVTPGTLDALMLNQNNQTNGAPYFFHLFKNCPNTSPTSGLAGLDPTCLNHTFPDAAFTGDGSSPRESATGIGDVVARVKWNAWEGERAGFAAGMDVRFPSGDALNYLGSGSYGLKPFAVWSYRARVSPHVLVGYEWNTDSITAGDLLTGTKGPVPNDFVYTVGADAYATKWLTGDFDIVGQRFFGADTVAVTQQQFLANCDDCSTNPSPGTVTLSSLTTFNNTSYSITNASIGIKARPFGKVSRLVLTLNVLVRLDSGGLSSKPVPLVGLGYTF